MNRLRVLAGLVLLALPRAARGQETCAALPLPDTLPAPVAGFVARFEVAESGLRRLSVLDGAGNARLVMTEDLVNAAWLPDGQGLVIAVSPIYGKPGLYYFSVRLGTVRPLVLGTHHSAAYPDGSDYFAVCGVTRLSGGGARVEYFRLPDVDRADFKTRPLRGRTLTAVAEEGGRRSQQP